MKKLLIILLIFRLTNISAQSVTEINNYRSEILKNLKDYKCISYTNYKPLNEDAERYDSIYFYLNKMDALVYIKKNSTIHYFNIQGDRKIKNEYVLMQNNVVFYSNFGFSFDNQFWNRQGSIEDEKISVFENAREYYKIKGEQVGKYKSRAGKGLYKNRNVILDSASLRLYEKKYWSERCDSCFKEIYEIFTEISSEDSDK